MILRNALCCDADGVRLRDVEIEGGRIRRLSEPAAGEGEDLGGAWLLPGFVVGHHHLYSALACGMPLLPTVPSSFTEMLEQVWWRLDRALDLEAVEVSARVGGLAALRAGATTLVDHHASPSAIAGSLEAVDRGLDPLGLRRVLCYEVTDRHGREGAREGLRAHEALLKERNEQRAVLVGMHAALSCSDETVRACAALARAAGVGVHVHVAEAVDDCVAGSPLRRLDRLGALPEGSLVAHGVHLDDEDLRLVADRGLWLAHQPRSNMNNAVGRARLSRFPERTVLGTDGIGGDMLAELQAGYFRSQEAGDGWGPARWAALVAQTATMAGTMLGLPLGRIAPGAAADLCVLDPAPGPPLLAENLAAALVFRLSSQQVRHVMVGGSWRLRDRMPVGLDVPALDAEARRVAVAVWGRMGG